LKALLLILTIFFSTTTYASTDTGIFTPSEADKSLEFLAMIFGNNPGGADLSLNIKGVNDGFVINENQNGIMSSIMASFNTVLLSIGTIILSYTIIVATINTAQEGTVMGKKWSAVWLPFRTMLGILLIAPNGSSGYSTIQAIVIWSIVKSVGFADTVWTTVLQSYNNSGSITYQPSLSITNDPKVNDPLNEIIKKITTSLVCMNFINYVTQHEEAWDLQNLKPLTNYFEDNPTITDSLSDYFTTRTETLDAVDIKYSLNGNSYIGASKQNNNKKPLNSDHPPLDTCGQFNIVASIKLSEDLNISSEKFKSYSRTDQTSIYEYMQLLASIAYDAKITFLKSAISIIDPIAKKIAIDRVRIDYDGTPNKNLENWRKKLASENYDIPQRSTDKIANILKQDFSTIYDELRQASSKYFTAMAAMSRTDPIPINSNAGDPKDVKGWMQDGSNAGWITAGSLILKLVSNTNNEPKPVLLKTASDPSEMIKCTTTTDIIQENIPKFLGISIDSGNNLSNIIKNLKLDVDNFIQYYKITPNAITPVSEISAIGSAALAEANSSAIKSMDTLLFSNHEKDGGRILSISKFGGDLMLAAETTWLVTMFLNMLVAAGAGICSAAQPGIWIFFIGTFFFITLIAALVICLWSVGALLGIYTPMVPYLMFAFSAIAWIILVIEAVVAAPIMGLSLMLPGGDELGKITTGLSILSGILLRPTLMIFGLVLGTLLFDVCIEFINFGMKAAVEVNTSGSLLSSIPILFMYTFIVLSLVNRAYSLIYVLPDRVLRWVGIAPESTDVKDMEQAKAGFDAAKGLTQEALSKSLSEGRKEVGKKIK
jgi:conjugal transfer/type IV secretion protein DotA/TraY